MAEVVKTQGPQPRTVACAEEPPSNSAAVEPLADLVAEDRAVWAAIVSDLLEPAQWLGELRHERNRPHAVSLGAHQPAVRPVRAHPDHLTRKVDIAPRQRKRLAATQPGKGKQEEDPGVLHGARSVDQPPHFGRLVELEVVVCRLFELVDAARRVVSDQASPP